MKTAFIPLLIGSFSAANAAAADDQRLLACYQIQEAAARLQCFDLEIAPLARQALAGPQLSAPVQGAAGNAEAASATARSPSPAPTAPAVSRPEFGEEQLKPARQSLTSEDPVSIAARIASLRTGGQGTYLVTLDNGQVWRHEEGSQAEFLKVGDAVTISRAALGSYRLTRDAGRSKNWIRVTRIR